MKNLLFINTLILNVFVVRNSHYKNLTINAYEYYTGVPVY